MASLTINPAGIEHNTRLVRRMIAPLGARLVGVTKACLGDVKVAAAMLAGGAGALADSRPENIERLRRRFPDTELELLRPLGAAGKPADTHADLFFVSNADQAQALLPAEQPRRLCLMVETGDGREGVPTAAAPDEAGRLLSLGGAVLAGLATSTACARPGAAVTPALDLLLGTADLVRRVAMPGSRNGFIISAGGSGLLRQLVAGGDGPAQDSKATAPFRGLTELRCGEALLLGRIPGGEGPGLFLPGAHRDAFLLEGTVLEVYRKGGAVQALLDFGSQDIGAATIIPRRDGISVTTVTSDYVAVTLESDGSRRRVRAGGCLSFLPTYHSLLAAMTSPFIEKRYTGVSFPMPKHL